MPERCPTCGSVVEVVTADEGTSSYRSAEDLPPGCTGKDACLCVACEQQRTALEPSPSPVESPS
jgi:hypothetical protein